MYVNGHGSVEIVQFLNGNNYLSPTGYRKTGIIQDTSKTNYKWNEVTLCNMLKNEVYIGNTVQNKKCVVSYKVKKIRTVEKENQIRVNDTHEPLIDKDVFEKVGCIFEKKGTNTKLKYDYLLRGLLYCHHCKRKLQIVLKKNSSKSTKSLAYITCSNYKERNCYPININYNKFEDYIIYVIKKICRIYINKNMLYSVYEKYQNKTIDIRKEFIKKIELIDKAIADINNSLDKMYMDRLQNIIFQEDFVRISSKLSLDRTNLTKEKTKLKQELNLLGKNLDTEKTNKDEKNFNKLLEDFLRLDKIDKIYLYRLINRIEIDKNKNVYIFFNFSKLNSVSKNLDGFIRIEELINKN